MQFLSRQYYACPTHGFNCLDPVALMFCLETLVAVTIAMMLSFTILRREILSQPTSIVFLFSHSALAVLPLQLLLFILLLFNDSYLF